MVGATSRHERFAEDFPGQRCGASTPAIPSPSPQRYCLDMAAEVGSVGGILRATALRDEAHLAGVHW